MALVSATRANNVGEHSHFDIAAKAAFLFRHILAALQMLRIYLFGRPKRRKQPERYVQYQVNFFEKILKK
jgi:hypothetical protein